MNAIEAHTPSLAPKFAHLVLNALPHPVLMIELDDRIADADVAAEDFNIARRGLAAVRIECPGRLPAQAGRGFSDLCGVRCRDLPKVL